MGTGCLFQFTYRESYTLAMGLCENKNKTAASFEIGFYMKGRLSLAIPSSQTSRYM